MKPSAYLETHFAQALVCPVYYFKKYEPYTFNGQIYIIGTERDDARQNAPNENKLYTSMEARGKDLPAALLIGKEQRVKTDLLLSLLNLYEKLTPGLYGRWAFTDHDIELVCAWCSRYGMGANDYSLDNESLWMKERKIGFSLRSFYNRLHHMYGNYELWRRVYYDDTDESNFYARTPIEECKSMLAGWMMQIDIHLKPDFSVMPAKYLLECPDLLEVAKGQLLFECMVTDEYYTIGICEVCKGRYEKTRKNNTLCPSCQATRYKRTRERQRIEKLQNKEGDT